MPLLRRPVAMNIAETTPSRTPSPPLHGTPDPYHPNPQPTHLNRSPHFPELQINELQPSAFIYPDGSLQLQSACWGLLCPVAEGKCFDAGFVRFAMICCDTLAATDRSQLQTWCTSLGGRKKHGLARNCGTQVVQCQNLTIQRLPCQEAGCKEAQLGCARVERPAWG